MEVQMCHRLRAIVLISSLLIAARYLSSPCESVVCPREVNVQFLVMDSFSQYPIGI